MKISSWVGVLVVIVFAVLLSGCTGGMSSASASGGATATDVEASPSPTAQVSPSTATPTVPSTPSATPESPTSTPPQPATPQTPTQQQPTETSSAPTSQPSPTIAGTSASACTNVAGFFGDVTIPDGTAFQQKQTFTKTWRIRNEGTCTWGKDYTLVFYGRDQMSGPQSNPMPAAAPGEIVDVSVNLVAPSSGGAFTGLWEFQDPTGARFGTGSGGHDPIWVKIGVTIFDASGTAVPVGSTPVPVRAGQANSSPASDPAASTPAAGQPTSTPAAAGCAPQRNTDYDQQILTKINTARVAAGLDALTLNPKLSAAAYAHSVDLACNHFVDHTGSDGSTWYTRIVAQGYTWSWASENTYVGNPAFGGTPDGAFTWWMNSKIHHDTIFSTRFSEIGVAYVFLASSDWGGYYNVEFAHP